MKTVILFLTLSLFCISLKGNYNEMAAQPWGVDAELAYMKREKTEIEKTQMTKGKSLCCEMIRLFQHYISPIDGPRSSFYPTSSQYALEAIEKHGIFKGIALGCDRLMRENSESWVYQRTDKYGIERKLDPVR